jgi:hypothetical protein
LDAHSSNRYAPIVPSKLEYLILNQWVGRP